MSGRSRRAGATTPAFDGYVLSGGSSRRMGHDKALLEVDGVAMARRVADALVAAGAGRVAAVGGDEPRLAALGLDTCTDRWPGAGPLGGLLTALDDPGTAAVAVVLSCDLLAPDPAAIARLVEERHRHDADAAVPLVDDRHQWLHAAWHRRVLAPLTERFRAGERSLRGAARAIELLAVDHVDATAVRDADRPEDLPGDGSGPILS